MCFVTEVTNIYVVVGLIKLFLEIKGGCYDMIFYKLVIRVRKVDLENEKQRQQTAE